MNKCPKCGYEGKHQHKFMCADRLAAIVWSKNILEDTSVIYLDLETTGLTEAEIVQIGIIDYQGKILLDSLICPTKDIEVGAQKVHGISDLMVLSAPTFVEIYPQIKMICDDKLVVIYNAAFDALVIERLTKENGLKPINAISIHCAMLQYAQFVGDWNSYFKNYKWPKLQGGDHSAAGDCIATLDVIKLMAK